MALFFEFAILLGFSLVGEALQALIPLPIPASIYGTLLLLLALQAGWLPARAIRRAATFLLAILPALFIPAGVGLRDSFSLIAPRLLPYLVLIVASTLAVMAVSGRTVQALRKRENQEADR